MTEYMRGYRKTKRELLRDAAKARRDEFQWRGIQLLGGKCQFPDCGRVATKETMCAFDFHHLDPSEKKWTIAQVYTRAWEAVEEEILKCELLCAFCHRLVEYQKLQDRAAPKLSDLTEQMLNDTAHLLP